MERVTEDICIDARTGTIKNVETGLEINGRLVKELYETFCTYQYLVAHFEKIRYRRTKCGLDLEQIKLTRNKWYVFPDDVKDVPDDVAELLWLYATMVRQEVEDWGTEEDEAIILINGFNGIELG